MMKYVFFGLIYLLLFACQNSVPIEKKIKTFEKKDAYKQYLIGKWETKKFILDMPSYKGAQDRNLMSIDFDNENDPLAKMKALPIYKSDGTFDSWYIDSMGNEFGQTTGTWTNDSSVLFVQFKYQDTMVFPTYHMKKLPFRMQFYSIYDWDKDGLHDDTLYMESLKL